MAAKTAQNVPGVPKNGTRAALRRSSPELAKVRPGFRVSPKSQGYGEAPGFAKVAEGNRPYKTLERISASARGRNQAVAENNIPYRPLEQRLSSATLAKRTASAERAAPATREPTRDAGAALAAPRRGYRGPGKWDAGSTASGFPGSGRDLAGKKTGAPRKECTRLR